jgi:hypothetical protein
VCTVEFLHCLQMMDEKGKILCQKSSLMCHFMKQKYAVLQNAWFLMLKQVVHIFTILRVVLCGCGSLLLTLKEKQRLSVFENRVLRTVIPFISKPCCHADSD